MAGGHTSARDAVLSHLAREEVEALPLVQTHLSEDRWKTAQTNAAKEYGLGDLRFAVPWSARDIPPTNSRWRSRTAEF